MVQTATDAHVALSAELQVFVALSPCEEVVTVPDVFSLNTPREEGYAVVDRAERQRQAPGGAEKGTREWISAESAAMQEQTARAARMQAVAETVGVALYRARRVRADRIPDPLPNLLSHP